MPLASNLIGRPLPGWVLRRLARAAVSRRLAKLEPASQERPAPRARQTLREVSDHQTRSARETCRLRRDELPAAFWEEVLGSQLMGCCSYWPRWAKDLDRAETEMLTLLSERAELASGQRVLEIGSSWGAVGRWTSSQGADLDHTVLASEAKEREFISSLAACVGPPAPTIIQEDLDSFHPDRLFDRVLVVEGLAASANPVASLAKLAGWLRPDGQLLWQTTCHWRSSYWFEAGDENAWIFPDVPDGALFPGDELLEELVKQAPPGLSAIDKWDLSGEHYERTLNAWLTNLESRRDSLRSVLREGADRRPTRTLRTLRTWLGALACQREVFGFREGQEWAVSQLLFKRTGG